MARKIRIEYAGAVYHVMARGHQGQPVFADDRDRKLWLHTLGGACEKTGWRIHAYVNPARAKLIQVGKARLSRYRWSSYP